MGLFDETAKAIPGQDVGDTSTSGLGSLAAKAIQKAVDDGVLNANTVNTPLSDLRSIIVRDPSRVDPSFDISGVRTTTPTRSELLAAVPEFSGFEYDPTQRSYFEDLYSLYGGAVPTVDVAQDTAQIPGAVDTLVDVGGGGGIDQVTVPGAINTLVSPTNTQFEQNLLDQGVGVQGAVGDPVVAPGEMPLTQDDFDAFNQIPVTPNLNDIDLGNPFDDPRIVSEEQGLTGRPSMLGDFGGSMDQMSGAQQTLEAEDVDAQGNLLQTGINKIKKLIPDFDPLITTGKIALNTFVGKPISLVFDAIRALASQLPPGISETTNKAREVGLLQGDSTVTQDKYGINTQSLFGDYNQYNLDRVEVLENKINKTPRDEQELIERKNYIESTGAAGDITPDATPLDIATGNVTGDATIAETIAQNQNIVDEVALTGRDDFDVTNEAAVNVGTPSFEGFDSGGFDPAPAPAPAPTRPSAPPSQGFRGPDRNGGSGRDSGGGSPGSAGPGGSDEMGSF